jgi:hypothetical protein
MWRWVAAALVTAAAVGLGLLLRELIHDETTAGVIAAVAGGFGIALLWPVEFGLKERPPS